MIEFEHRLIISVSDEDWTKLVSYGTGKDINEYLAPYFENALRQAMMDGERIATIKRGDYNSFANLFFGEKASV